MTYQASSRCNTPAVQYTLGGISSGIRADTKVDRVDNKYGEGARA